MAHRHCQSAVGALLRCQPLIAQLGDFREVRGYGDGFGAFVTHFGEEVSVRCTRLRHVRSPGDDVAGVVPVGRLRHIGLLAPGHWRGGRQIAVPVVKTQAGAAEERKIPRTGGVRDHRHRRDRRESGDAIRAVMFDCPDVRGGDQLVEFFPVRADKTAVAARFFVAAGLLRIAHDGIPRQHRVAMLAQRFAPQFDQFPAHQRVFQAVGAVEIPGVTRAARAAAGFMIGQVRAGAGVVGLLRFPGHQAVFDIDFPAAGAGTVNAVGGSHDFVELPALAIAVLPVAVGVHHLPMAVGEGVAFLFEITKAIQQFTHDVSPDGATPTPWLHCSQKC
ncbi:hypothetical protein D3C72_772260 [compost metagenome]